MSVRVELRWWPRGNGLQGCMEAHHGAKPAIILKRANEGKIRGWREIWKDSKMKRRVARRIIYWLEAGDDAVFKST